MSHYKTCPACNAHLDYGERCTCQKESALTADTARAPDDEPKPTQIHSNYTPTAAAPSSAEGAEQ